MDDLHTFLGSTTARPVPVQVQDFAQSLAAAHAGVVAVLAYGSAIRDSAPGETLIDYYLLVDEPQHIGSNALLRWLGQRVPPNVYYAERVHDGATLRSKYAVMTLQNFATWNSAATANPYLWARFAQPCRLLQVKDEITRDQVLAALGEAARTAFGHGIFLSPASPWEGLFSNTYRTELRPESANRATQIVAADATYYASLSQMLQGTPPMSSSWGAKRVLGKVWSLARLAKAAFTFQGGADYAAWKIERHSGMKIEVTAWQRRHPFLAGLLLLPKILRRKGLS
jgi:hypothetical protein